MGSNSSRSNILFAGHLLEKIVLDTTSKLYNEKSSSNKKLYLYAGHEFNIAALLSTLGLFVHEVPPYGAYLTMEIHNFTDNYGFKVTCCFILQLLCNFISFIL